MTQTATGSAIALLYGYQWVTGVPIGKTTRLNTENDNLDFTRIGGWALGEGELDGCEELWDSALDRLLFTSEFDDPTKFHFHRGCDAVIGSGFAANSQGPDQGVDSFTQYLPSGVQPLCYNRIANYWLCMKNFINNPPTNHQNDPNNFADLNPIGLWRGLRVRLFDETGQMTGYGFTTTPTWQNLDLILRRKVFPEYSLDLNNGPDDLTDAVRKRFDWGAIAAHAAACDTVLPNGNRQFEGNFTFNQTATVQALQSTMMQTCRSFFQERAGKIGFYVDAPRASVFTLSRKNTLSFSATDRDLHTAPNRIVGKFRDIEIPVCADIASISFADHTEPIITTVDPHPCAAGDRIVIGATDTTYDTTWIVDTVPGGDGDGDVYTMTLKTRGSNYPASVGTGGVIGLLYSRFKERAPEFNHHRNQYARGAIGVGIPRQRNKVKVEIDFATSNYDQVSRVSRYERDRALGVDVIPYVSPASLDVELDLFALDAAGSGNVALGIDPGDRITVDDTLSVPYAGDYEVIDAGFQPDAVQTGSDAAIARTASAGRRQLKLATYNPAIMYSSSDPTAAGWRNVPGSAPGNQVNFTQLDLADGFACFFTGGAASGDRMQLPAIGSTPANFLGWVSPQGYIEGSEHLHYIQQCDLDANQKITMVWSSDVGVIWTGDVNTAGVSWRTRNSARVFSQGAMSYVELTLSGGELIVFGRGTIADSTAVPLPDGYSAARAVMLSFMRDGVNTDHPAHGCRSYVDASGNAHMDYQDGEGNVWHGNSVAFVFAFKNNLGTWSQLNGWSRCTLASGKTLAIGGFSILDARLSGTAPANFPSTMLTTVTNGVLPTPSDLPRTSLQVLTGSNSFQITDHDAHGVKECYVDNLLNSLSSFEDGEGNTWFGSSGVFALLCDTADGTYAGGSSTVFASAGTSPVMAPVTLPYGSANAVLSPNYDGDGTTFTLYSVDVDAPGSAYTSASTASVTDGTTTVPLTLTLNSTGGITSAVPATTPPTFTSPPTVTLTR